MSWVRRMPFLLNARALRADPSSRSVRVLALAFALSLLVGCRPSIPDSSQQNVVVVYASQDQVYAEPILQRFTEKTGIAVRSLYDSEAVKTVGLANRLLAERAHPQCDVFWNNEALRTHQLAAAGLWRTNNAIVEVGYRSRRLVINTNLVSPQNVPRALRELTNETWRGRVALAYPLFGTTATHFLALREHWGEVDWLIWCRALAANQPMLVEGNSMVVRQVGRGDASIGLTDSDDIVVGQQRGEPITALPLMEELLLIPNTVAVLREAPHPAAAQALFTFLQSAETVQALIAANAVEGADPKSVRARTVVVEWSQLLPQLPAGIAQLEGIFLR